MPKNDDMPTGTDIVLDMLIANNRPLTLENYLDLAYPDRSPEELAELGAEELSMVPSFLFDDEDED